MKKSAKAWLDAAEEDMNVIIKLLNNELTTGAASFHAQQCIEKCLKAILDERNERVPRIHDLSRLFDHVYQFLKIKFDENIVDQLNSLYIEARYPGAFGFLPTGKPTIEDVNEFYIYAKYIFDEVAKYLNKK